MNCKSKPAMCDTIERKRWFRQRNVCLSKEQTLSLLNPPNIKVNLLFKVTCSLVTEHSTE